MATSSGSSTHSPPPSAECQSPQQNSEFEVFDRAYYRKGKVLIIPDVRKPKVDFFKKAPPPQPAATPGGQNARVTTRRNRQRRQEGEHESFELDKNKMNNPSRVREQEADDSEVIVIELIKTALEEDMKPDDPPVFLLHSQFLTSRTISGTSAEPFKIDKSKGEMDILIFHPTLGILFVEVKSTRSVDFHTQQWDATQTIDLFSPINKGTTQLIRNQTSIQEEIGDLLENDGFVLTIALPNLKPEASSIIRKEAEERKRKKQTSDVEEGAKSTEQAAIASPMCDSRPEKELLEDHPEILLLCGSTPEVFIEWARHLRQLRASAGHAFKGSTVQERLDNFKRACIRRLSIAGLRPGQSVKDGAALHHRFLLTEEQLNVRDSQAHLLHVWGPPGSGKTLLLTERARWWIREGKRVVLAVGGQSFFTPLLHLLTRSVCSDKTDMARVSTHSNSLDLLKWLDSVSTADPAFIILDEAGFLHNRILEKVTAGLVGGLWSADTRDLKDKDKEDWLAKGGTTEQLRVCLRCPPSVMTLSNTVGREGEEPPLLPPPVPVTQELGVGVEVISHADHGQSQSYEECPTCRKKVKNFFSSLGLPGDDVTSSLSLSDCIVITSEYSADRERVARWLGGLGLRAMAVHIDYLTPVLLPGQTPTSDDQARDEARRSRVVTGTDTEGKPVIHIGHCDDFQGLERAVVVVWHQDWMDEAENFQGQEARDRRMKDHTYYLFRAMTRCQGRLLLVAATPSPLLSLLPASSPASRPSSPPEWETLYLRCQASPGLPQAAGDVTSHAEPAVSVNMAAETRPLTPSQLEILKRRAQEYRDLIRTFDDVTSHAEPAVSVNMAAETQPSSPPEWETIYLSCQVSPGLPQAAGDVTSHADLAVSANMAAESDQAESSSSSSPPGGKAANSSIA